MEGGAVGHNFERDTGFLPSLSPFGQAVTEEKIFFSISQSENRINLGDHVGWPNGTK
jgi:hypothetical protein